MPAKQRAKQKKRARPATLKKSKGGQPRDTGIMITSDDNGDLKITILAANETKEILSTGAINLDVKAPPTDSGGPV